MPGHVAVPPWPLARSRGQQLVHFLSDPMHLIVTESSHCALPARHGSTRPGRRPCIAPSRWCRAALTALSAAHTRAPNCPTRSPAVMRSTLSDTKGWMLRAAAMQRLYGAGCMSCCSALGVLQRPQRLAIVLPPHHAMPVPYPAAFAARFLTTFPCVVGRHRRRGRRICSATHRP